MKATRHFIGTTTFGAKVERAQAANGAWYAREYAFNGRGMAWGKWYKTEAPTFETTATNVYTGEVSQLDTPRAMWGFQPMRELSGPHSIRLPA